MAGSNVCWGLEIGGGALKAIKLEADGGELRVLDFAVVEHPKVLSTPELDQSDAIRVALGQLASQHDLTDARLALSMPGHQSFARFAKLPPVDPKKVPDIVKFEAVQQIPFPLEDVEWDYQTFVSPASPDVEVGIFAITRQRINERLGLLSEVGLSPDYATISPVAAYNALAVDLEFTEDTPGTIILDIGTVATDLIIAESGRVWVRTFPIGGHQFTEALVNTFKTTYGKAEKLKREAEQSKHARHVFQAMRPVFGDLVQEVQRSIGFYTSVHPDADLKRLIGLGNTFRLPGLRKYIKQQLQLDVYRMEQFKKLSVDGPRAGAFQQASLNLATAYGLALQGLDQATLKANLMPVKVLRDSMWRRKVPYFAAAAGLAAAAAGAMFIRPLIDSTQFSGADKPGVIDRVVREAGQLKRDAEEAGVTGEVASNLAAARVVSMMDSPDLYGSILADVSGMLERADRVAGDGAWPAVEVVRLNTEYRPGSGAGGAGMDDGFANDDRFGSRGAPAPGASARAGADEGNLNDADSQAALASDRVRIEMVVRTTASDAQRAIEEGLEAWVRENATRDGVPYRLVIARDKVNPWTRLGTDDRPGASDPRLGTRPPDPRLAGRVDAPRIAASRAARPSARASAGSRDINQLAPLGEPARPAPEATGEFRIVWFALLEAPQPEGDA